MIFKRFTEIKAKRLRFCYDIFVNVKNKIVFVSQVYLHPRACGEFNVICLVIEETIDFLISKILT